MTAKTPTFPDRSLGGDLTKEERQRHVVDDFIREEVCGTASESRLPPQLRSRWDDHALARSEPNVVIRLDCDIALPQKEWLLLIHYGLTPPRRTASGLQVEP